MSNSDRLSKNYLDIAIHAYEPTMKVKIYETVAKSVIPHDDPYKAIEEYAVSVIDFPKLGDAKRIEINAKRMMFSDAVNYAEFGIIGRNQIKTFLRNAYSAFDSTNIFAGVHKKEVKA